MQLHRAILVDDEVYTRKGLLKLMDWESCGFEVIGEADDGEDALELIHALQPDLVITDIRMPVLDGLELIGKAAVDNIHSPEFVIISGYNDFNYAKQAIRYGVHDFILKPVDDEELSAALNRLNHRLTEAKERQNRQVRLSSGTLKEEIIMGRADAGFIRQWEEKLMLRADEPLYYVLLELNDQHPWHARGHCTLQQFREYAEQVLRSLTDAHFPLYVHEHRSRLGILISDQLLTAAGKSLSVLGERMVSRLEALLPGRRIFVYMGQPVRRLSDLRLSYERAVEMLAYKYMYESTGVVPGHEKPGKEPQYVMTSQAHIDSIIERIEETNRAEMELAIHILFTTFQEQGYAPEAVKMNIHRCVLGVQEVIRSMGGGEQPLAAAERLLGWHDLNLSLGELKRLFIGFAVESSHEIVKLRRERQRGGIHQIREYIEEHYSENISLKSMAARFYMNPVYLGQLFKKTYGTYFNDYLLQLRMTEAKRLLRQSDLRIYEVAERVGFCNADYFVTQFEKLEQLKPSEYRSRMQQVPQSSGVQGAYEIPPL
ncbi:response regulator [Paenibacillus sp. JX-17]|uniref:Response regulator n=1 Tax=Paenibacillus lacisoli TaxID=3064525 RepID=A0ABT9CHD9_9BACL|nr:response regulator [Paenibacillus sp. JX-17]MDO7907018.1 response regulator [Paenibacillus sp. JX-17]